MNKIYSLIFKLKEKKKEQTIFIAVTQNIMFSNMIYYYFLMPYYYTVLRYTETFKPWRPPTQRSDQIQSGIATRNKILYSNTIM